ncbi:lipoxygenase homology domain-containing 1 isoform X1, partial [Brachionus plicatilis]
AGTDANVYLTLFGEFGDSGEKELIESNHGNKFERKQIDRFFIRTADLGPLFKCLIRHDGSGISSDWLLDRVEVTEGRNKYIFVCERWLSKSRDDKKLERIIFEKNYNGPRITSTSSLSIKSNIGGSKMAGSDPRLSIRQQSPFGQHHDLDGPTIPYRVTIRTGDEKKCGISSQAFIRLFGESKKQRTERIKLQLAKKSRFEPGSSENFQIEALDIGELRQIEIGHDGAGPNESWFVKYIEISEPIKGRTYFITCNSWLSTEKGDGLTVRRFNVDETNTKISSFRGLIPYILTIHTGDVPKAGTDSDVTLKFFGSKGTSGDIVIEKIDNRFDRDSIDTVNIDLDDIGSLKKVRVSHDGKGSRKEWFLDRIEMTNAKTKKQYVFVAEQWLSKKRADSRGLSIDVPVFRNNEQTIGMTDYKILVKTSDISGAGTDANVFITLFGENGDTGELELKKTKALSNLFEKGQTDEFNFKDILSVGEITKLRIWHDNTGNLLGNTHWHLDSVQIHDSTTGRVYKFECKKWLSKSKDDKQLVRELTPILDSRDEPSPGAKTTYEITVQTADEADAGTKHNIEIVLIGDYGETRPKLFENTSENKILRRGHSDIFAFNTRSVGELREILLSHVGNFSKSESQWICDYVKIKDLNTGTVYKFPVMSIFKLNKKPKAFKCETKKESQVSLTRGLKNVDYEVLVVTGSEKGAGTNATASITIYGKNGDSGKRVLKKGFDRSEKEEFIIECLDLGEITKVHIEHDNTSFKKDWFLERIEIKDKSTGRHYVFPCEKWLSKNKE